MDSFGTCMAKMIFLFFVCFVNAEFYRAVWTIKALLTIRSEMLPFSENNQNIKIFRVPPNTYIGYILYIMIICHWACIALQYVIQNICRKVWRCFIFMISCTFWRSRRKKLSNSPKLSCGLKKNAYVRIINLWQPMDPICINLLDNYEIGNDFQ